MKFFRAARLSLSAFGATLIALGLIGCAPDRPPVEEPKPASNGASGGGGGVPDFSDDMGTQPAPETK